MAKKDEILQVYFALRDCLEDDDDFQKMKNIIESMSSIDAKKAYDMWYSLLSQYEDYITNDRPNASYELLSAIDSVGRGLGSSVLDKMILSDRYLYELLFKRSFQSGGHFTYTQGMVSRALSQSNLDLADQMFSDIYSNGNRRDWFEIMDGFFLDIKWGDLNVNDLAKELLVKWSTKITEKKDRAKIMSSILATGQSFDLGPFTNNRPASIKSHSTNGSNDFSGYIDLISKLLLDHPEALKNRQLLKSLLLDYFPQKKLIVNSLLMAFDEGIIDEIVSYNSEIDLLAEQRMQRMLVNNYGISADLSNSIISTWIKAINQSIKNKNIF